MIAGLLIVLGVIISAFGLWVIASSRDPLGYFPPLAPVPLLFGMVVILVGFIIKACQWA